jgi:hypothetical protein
MRFHMALFALLLGIVGCTEQATPEPAVADNADSTARAENARKLAHDAYVDSLRNWADSVLGAISPRDIRSLPDTLVDQLRTWAHANTSHANNLRLISAESDRRGQARERERAAAVAQEKAARVSEFIQSSPAQCTKGTPARIQRVVRENWFWSTEILAAVSCGWVQRGMDYDQLEESLGRPRKVNRSVGAWGEREQWVYGDRGPYVYLDNGIVTSWQTSR